MKRRRSGERGRLIVLEGIDGAGKSAVARRLLRRWRAAGARVELRREPGEPGLGEAALAAARNDPWNSAMLFSLDRLLARESVDAALDRGRTILQDRSYFSTLAYQASRCPPAARRRIEAMQRRIARRPDLVIWLDLPPRVALSRVARRGRRRAPVEQVRFLEGVRRAYRRLSMGPAWVVVDATRPLPEVVREADRRGRRLLGLAGAPASAKVE